MGLNIENEEVREISVFVPPVTTCGGCGGEYVEYAEVTLIREEGTCYSCKAKRIHKKLAPHVAEPKEAMEMFEWFELIADAICDLRKSLYSWHQPEEE
jgi:hypothetical protein